MRAELHSRLMLIVVTVAFGALVFWCVKTFVDPGVQPVTVKEPDPAAAAEAPDQPEPPPSWTAHGRVLDRRAQPLEDIRIEARDARLEPDSEGRFEIPGIPHDAPTVEIVVYKKGYALETRTVVRDRQLDVRLRKLVDVGGEVFLPGGAPAPGVAVRVIDMQDREKVVVTGPDGRFVAKDVGEGRYRFIVEPHAGAAGPFLGTAGLANSDDEPVLLGVESGRAVRGLVTGPDGTPVAGADCSAQCYYRQRRRLMARATTDSDGRFTLVVPPNAQTTVRVDTPIEGEGMRFLHWARTRVEKVEGELAIQLAEGKALEGRIGAPRGTRIAGRELNAYAVVGNGLRIAARGTLRDDGSFRIGGLSPKLRYKLTLEGLTGPTDSYVLSGGYRVAPGAGDLDLQLSIARSFGGQVLSADGTPVAKRTVRVHKEEVGYIARTMSDENGRFEVPRTPPGELKVTVAKPGRHKGVFDCGTFRAGDTAVEIRLPD